MVVIGLILANPTDVDPDDVERDEPFQSRATLGMNYAIMHKCANVLVSVVPESSRQAVATRD